MSASDSGPRAQDASERACARCGCRALTEVPLQIANSVALVCPNCGRQRICSEGQGDRCQPPSGQPATSDFLDRHHQ